MLFRCHRRFDEHSLLPWGGNSEPVEVDFYMFFFLKCSQSRHRLLVALLGTNCLPSQFMHNVRHRRLSDLICTDWNTMSQLTCRAAGFLPEMVTTVACVCSISVPAWMEGPSEFVSLSLHINAHRFFIPSFSKWTKDPFFMLRIWLIVFSAAHGMLMRLCEIHLLFKQFGCVLFFFFEAVVEKFAVKSSKAK